MRGIFCVDPGASTGVAWGILNEKDETAIKAVSERMYSSSLTLQGTEQEQIRDLYAFWTGFKKSCVQGHCMEPETIDLVIEDFVLFPGEKPGRATTIAERVAWGFEGYRMAMFDHWRARWPKHYTPISWQMSGAANRFTKREILTQADAWIRGKEHERSAFAHMILRTNVLMDNRVTRARVTR
jgi:hypothetical protein